MEFSGLFWSLPDFECLEPLGMESGEISSEQITASSQYNNNWSPERSRLNYQENGWTPSDDTVREWVQVGEHLEPLGPDTLLLSPECDVETRLR